MSPVPASRPRPRDAAKHIDDFEWPPTADELSVYELGPEPWQTRQRASRPVVAPRQRERPQPHQKPAPKPVPETTQKLAAVLAAFAIIAAVVGCVMYWAMARPVPVRAFHHPAPPVAATPPLPPITIIATYPVDPDPANEAPASHGPSPGNAAAASQPGDSSDTSRVTPDATPVDAPAGQETAPGPSEAAAPSVKPAAVKPAAVDPDSRP
jgi:hypothetical protein